MYLCMPVLFAALSRRWAHLRRAAAVCGTVLACVGFLTSSYSTTAEHLVITQGVLAALGCTLGELSNVWGLETPSGPLNLHAHDFPYETSSDLTSLRTNDSMPQRILLDKQSSTSLWCGSLLQKHHRICFTMAATISPRSLWVPHYHANLDSHRCRIQPCCCAFNATTTSNHSTLRTLSSAQDVLGLPPPSNVLHLQHSHRITKLWIWLASNLPEHLRTLGRFVLCELFHTARHVVQCSRYHLMRVLRPAIGQQTHAPVSELHNFHICTHLSPRSLLALGSCRTGGSQWCSPDTVCSDLWLFCRWIFRHLGRCHQGDGTRRSGAK